MRLPNIDDSRLLLVGSGLAALVYLGGCQEVRNENIGQVTGAAVGGLLGAQIGQGKGRLAATAAGAVAGLLIGGRLGSQMDETDQQRARASLETTPTGQTNSWVNPDNGNRYAVTPSRTYDDAGGRSCREYTTEAWVDGRRETVVGRACRDTDGTWTTL